MSGTMARFCERSGFVMLAAGAVLALTVGGGAAQEKWDLVGYLGLNAPISQILSEFGDEVEVATEGRVSITVRAPGELPYASGEYHRVVGNGEVAMADTAWFTSDVSAAGLLTSAMLVQNFDDLAKAMPLARSEIEAGLDRFGAEILFYYAHPPIKFYGRGAPVTSLEGISGLKVRALTPEHTELLELLGATAVPIAAPELITAIQYGTVNAALTTGVGVLSLQWQDVLDWCYEMELAPTPSYIIVNSEMFAALSEADQQSIRTLAAKYQQRLLESVTQQEIEIQDQLRADGMVITPAAEEDRTRLYEMVVPSWEKWAAARGGSAPELLKTVRESVGR